MSVHVCVCVVNADKLIADHEIGMSRLELFVRLSRGPAHFFEHAEEFFKEHPGACVLQQLRWFVTQKMYATTDGDDGCVRLMDNGWGLVMEMSLEDFFAKQTIVNAGSLFAATANDFVTGNPLSVFENMEHLFRFLTLVNRKAFQLERLKQESKDCGSLVIPHTSALIKRYVGKIQRAWERFDGKWIAYGRKYQVPEAIICRGLTRAHVDDDIVITHNPGRRLLNGDVSTYRRVPRDAMSSQREGSSNGRRRFRRGTDVGDEDCEMRRVIKNEPGKNPLISKKK